MEGSGQRKADDDDDGRRRVAEGALPSRDFVVISERAEKGSRGSVIIDGPGRITVRQSRGRDDRRKNRRAQTRTRSTV